MQTKEMSGPEKALQRINFAGVKKRRRPLFTREDVDRYASQSQARAAHARDNGYFARSIVPVRDLNGVTILDHDELIRPTTMDGLAKLKQPNRVIMSKLNEEAK